MSYLLFVFTTIPEKSRFGQFISGLRIFLPVLDYFFLVVAFRTWTIPSNIEQFIPIRGSSNPSNFYSVIDYFFLVPNSSTRCYSFMGFLLAKTEPTNLSYFSVVKIIHTDLFFFLLLGWNQLDKYTNMVGLLDPTLLPWKVITYWFY